MKKYLSILCMIVVISMCFSLVAMAQDDYEMPTIPLVGNSTTGDGDTTTGDGDTTTGDGDTTTGDGDTTTGDGDTTTGDGDTTTGDGDTTTGSDTTLDTTDSQFETPGVPLDDGKTSLKKCTVSGIQAKTYTGSSIKQSITVKVGKTTLKKDKDYTVTYKSNKYVGTATLTVKGIGKYKESVSKTFKINPKGTSLSKLTTPKKKQIKVTYKKQATQTTGYVIQYSTSSKFTSGTTKSVWVTSNKTTSKTIKNLKSKKRYYVRIRTYKTVNGTKYYSSWSASKYIKTK